MTDAATRTEIDVLRDLRAEINDETYAYLDTVVGLHLARTQIGLLYHPANDATGMVAALNARSSSSLKIEHAAVELGTRFGPEIRSRYDARGPLETWAGHSWAIRVFSAWNEIARVELAEMRGVHQDTIRVDLWGDLRRLRNEMVHNRGVASGRYSKGVKLLEHWIIMGTVRVIDLPRVEEFLIAIPWSEMTDEAVPDDLAFSGMN